MDTPQAIARKLTEAQRNAISYPGRYHDPNTIKALRRKGLLSGIAITPLGDAVRLVLFGEGP